MQLREDIRRGIYVENLTELEVETVGDILKLLFQVDNISDNLPPVDSEMIIIFFFFFQAVQELSNFVTHFTMEVLLARVLQIGRWQQQT